MNHLAVGLLGISVIILGLSFISQIFEMDTIHQQVASIQTQIAGTPTP